MKTHLRAPWLTPDEIIQGREDHGRMRYIITEDNEIAEEPSKSRWIAFLNRARHRHIIAQLVFDCLTPGKLTFKPCKVIVRTSFYGRSLDQLWITKITGGWHDGMSYCSETREEALDNHDFAVNLIRETHGYGRRHGRQMKKLIVRLNRMNRLEEKRDEWLITKLPQLKSLLARLRRIPSQPHHPLIMRYYMLDPDSIYNQSLAYIAEKKSTETQRMSLPMEESVVCTESAYCGA
jgi:hypothetical protein